MRILLTGLSLFILQCSFGQEIELQGKYGAGFLGAETIEFVGIDSFYFNGFYCTDGIHGKGRCEIRNNHLYLYFEKLQGSDRTDFIKSPEITKMQTNDSVAIVNITCVEANGHPISRSTVQLVRKDKTSIVLISDNFGHVSFAIKNEDMPLTIKTSVAGFEPSQVNVEDYASYNIRVFHKDALIKELNNSEIFVYEIDELSEDLILMRPENSKERFRKYKKAVVISNKQT